MKKLIGKRKEIMELIENDFYSTFYFTENPTNYSEANHGYKYFLCYHNTHIVKARANTLDEILYELRYAKDLKEGLEVEYMR